ncbi:putative protein [Pseudoclavibacter triregionum]|nr:putative protein [Pseudoclavibacter triregionum]
MPDRTTTDAPMLGGLRITSFDGESYGEHRVPQHLSDLLDDLRESHRAEARASARRSALLADMLQRALDAAGDRATSRELAVRSCAAEAAMELRLPQRGMQRRLHDAWTIAVRFPATQAVWSDGDISERHALAIARHGVSIEDDDVRALYEHELLEHAREVTAPELEALAERLAAEAGELTLDERYERAKRERHVRVTDDGDGMSTLRAHLPSYLAHAIADRLTQQAKAIREVNELEEARRRAEARGRAGTGEPLGGAQPSRAGLGAKSDAGTRAAETGAMPGDAAVAPIDDRSLDEIRADLLADLALGGESRQIADVLGEGAPRIVARIDIEVPALALAGASAEPAELLGVGPIPRQQALEAFGEHPELYRLVTDPVTRLPLASEQRLAWGGLRRTLLARDQTCRMPGCRRPAGRCDVDHTVPWSEGGATEPDNLAHLCRGHHTMKHETAWQVRQLGHGLLEWISPSGRVAWDRPLRTRVAFARQAVEDDPPRTSSPPRPADPADPPF